MINITHEGEKLGVGLNIGFANGLRIIWYWPNYKADTLVVKRIRFRRKPFAILLNSEVRADADKNQAVNYFWSKGCEAVTREELADLREAAKSLSSDAEKSLYANQLRKADELARLGRVIEKGNEARRMMDALNEGCSSGH